MIFSEAWELLKEGKKIKLPSWSGYWAIEKESNRVMMYCQDGRIIPLFETVKENYTLENIASDQWLEATEENCPLLGGRLHLSFEDAIRYTTRGCKMKNERLYPGKFIIAEKEGETFKFLLVSPSINRREQFNPPYEAMIAKDYEFFTE